MNEMVTRLDLEGEIAGAPSGLIVAVIAGVDADGRPLLRWGKARSEARPARVVWMQNSPDWAACKGLRAIAGFEDGDEERPILLGLLDAPPAAETSEAAVHVDAPARPEEARLDGERVVLSADKEIVLKCGRASITLTRAGKVLIRGAYLLNRSSGVNRIKGGSVQIN